MALSESRLSGKIVNIIDVIKAEEKDSESVIKKFSDALAKAIVEEMKLATVTGVCPPTGGALTLGKIN
jgi:hypothetical protein